MNTVVIGEELVRYGSVSADAPWRLLNCQRGAWGTPRRSACSGDAVAKLMDHDYKVFLTDADLSQEVARNIAKLATTRARGRFPWMAWRATGPPAWAIWPHVVHQGMV